MQLYDIICACAVQFKIRRDELKFDNQMISKSFLVNFFFNENDYKISRLWQVFMRKVYLPVQMWQTCSIINDTLFHES